MRLRHYLLLGGILGIFVQLSAFALKSQVIFNYGAVITLACMITYFVAAHHDNESGDR